MTEEQKKDLQAKVMTEINSGRLKLKSKYIFLAEKMGLGSAVALTVILAVLFFNILLFYLKASDNLFYLSFGSRGIFAFLESFPYLLVIGLILLLILAGYLFRHYGTQHRLSFGKIAIILSVIVILIGGSLAFTDLANRLERFSFEQRGGRFLQPLFHPGFENRSLGLAGRVIANENEFLLIQTQVGELKLDLSKTNIKSLEFLPGEFVMVIGNKTELGFEVENIRHVAEEDLLMIKRSVHRRFGEFAPPPKFNPPCQNERLRSEICPNFK